MAANRTGPEWLCGPWQRVHCLADQIQVPGVSALRWKEHVQRPNQWNGSWCLRKEALQVGDSPFIRVIMHLSFSCSWEMIGYVWPCPLRMKKSSLQDGSTIHAGDCFESLGMNLPGHTEHLILLLAGSLMA